MQKSLGFFRVMAAIAIATVMVFGEIASGTAENLTWVISNDGTLTISGTGDMPDYVTFAPWFSTKASIKKIVIDNGVTSISDFAFFDCRSLTSVEIPNSVTTIGKAAFRGCSRLTSVDIPASVIEIVPGAFGICDNLTLINVEAGNNNFASVDGVLFNKAKTTLIQYPGGKTETTYTIPASVIEVGEEAFIGSDKYQLSSIVIPNSMTYISDYAFVFCESLKSVVIPNSVTTIGKAAFSRCKSLTQVVIPNSVNAIKDNAFFACKSLTSVVIPNSVNLIEDSAFNGCDGLEQIINQAITPQSLEQRTFRYVTTSNIKLFVPDQSLVAYKAADVWKDFDIQPISTMPTAIGNAAAKQTFAISFAGIRNGEINLNLKAGNYTAELYNVQGRLVSSVNINALNGLNATGIKTNNLSKGMFILNVKQAGASVLKQKVRI